MPRVCPNLHFMYREFLFLDRFEAAARDGFAAIEMTFPYDVPAHEIAQRCAAFGLELVDMNLPAGELVPKVKRGIAALPGHEAEFDRYLGEGLDYARVIGCRRLLSLASMVPDTLSPAVMRQTLVDNLKCGSDRCAEDGVTLLMEPNNTIEHPGYPLRYVSEVAEIVDRVGRSNVRMVFDFFHSQLNEGNVVARFREYFSSIGHIQIGNVPGRHEPDRGKLDFRFIFAAIDASGYDGWVGCEYFPRTTTRDGLAWFKDWPEARAR